MSEVREQSHKKGRLWFLGVDAEEYTGELPEARSRLCVCRDSFLMTFVTSGISLAGSRQSSIAPNAVESREAPPNTTVSVSSQRHPEQLPEVTGTSRGNTGCPAATRDVRTIFFRPSLTTKNFIIFFYNTCNYIMSFFPIFL